MMDGGAGDAPGGAVLFNKRQLAAAMRVSVNTVGRWLDEGMPFVSGGSNGKAYEFDFGECQAWRDARNREREEEAQRVEAHLQQLRMELDPVAGRLPESLDPSQRAAEYEAAARHMAVARQRRELVEAAPMRDALERVFIAIRGTLETLPDEIAREEGLDGAAVERMARRCDRGLSAAHAAIRAMIEGRDDVE